MQLKTDHTIQLTQFTKDKQTQPLSYAGAYPYPHPWMFSSSKYQKWSAVITRQVPWLPWTSLQKKDTSGLGSLTFKLKVITQYLGCLWKFILSNGPIKLAINIICWGFVSQPALKYKCKYIGWRTIWHRSQFDTGVNLAPRVLGG